MKKAATQGTWKTPPNMVYAKGQDSESPAPPSTTTATQTSASVSAAAAVTGTKMQLMGLPFPQQRRAVPSMPTMFFNPGPGAPPIQVAPPPPVAVVAVAEPPPPPIAPAPPKRKSKKSTTTVTVDEAVPEAKEDKQKMLEHSRTMARLRRQQQRALTDSLESEFFELHATAAYLRALLASDNANSPLPKQEKEKVVHEAFERAVTQLTPHVPSARSQEMKTLVQSVHRMQQEGGEDSVAPLVQVPLAHQIQNLSLSSEEQFGTFLAVTLGSKKESFSFSQERKRSSLLFAMEETRGVFASLVEEEAAPLVRCLDFIDPAVLGNNGEVPQLLSSVRRLLFMKRATELLLCPALLSFPKTEHMVEQFRDTLNAEQINRLLTWSIQNENTINSLKFTQPRH
ncbi:hypothetical protein BASA81_000642 [Batrachochytrium salamandrivorans]|nr:hypothetical protein BASA81_000642 [Batrachochytrium salamandrivorans]